MKDKWTEKDAGRVHKLTSTPKGNLERSSSTHGKRADAIVKNMLLHSREGSGQHRPTDTNALLDDSLDLAYHGARAENSGFNITLQRNFDPGAGKVERFRSRRNIGVKSLCWGFKLQGLTWPFV
jgi:hypothetical protein